VSPELSYPLNYPELSFQTSIILFTSQQKVIVFVRYCLYGECH